jgi:hypothetical protein
MRAVDPTRATHPHITQFFDVVRPWMPAYVNSTLTFVALLHDHEFVILAVRLLSEPKDRPAANATRCDCEPGGGRDAHRW